MPPDHVNVDFATLKGGNLALAGGCVCGCVSSVDMRKPKRADGVPRKITRHIRFAADEYERIKEKADQAKISIADFIRKAAINKQLRIYKPPPPVNLKTYKELSAIGVNLNQLVRAVNTANRESYSLVEPPPLSFCINGTGLGMSTTESSV